ncbi:MAG: M50 family metallopeptidase [Candidatus Deferrimicrobiaceae bacterium]
MRVFLFSLAGIPLLLFDGVLLVTFPIPVGRMATREEGWIALAGAMVYLLVHFFLRKPERLYLWAHEFSHLVLAKLFFRKIHQFNISSRGGGKVVMDRTNVMIDLAPYIFPLYSVGTGIAASVFRNASPWVPDLYLAAASFLFTMHLLFSAEGFLSGQPDLRRSGRVFSAAVILLFLLLWIPCLMAPGVTTGWKGAAAAYREWLLVGGAAGGEILAHVRGLLVR